MPNRFGIDIQKRFCMVSWENRGVEERTRANYVNWGIGFAMVVVAAIIGHFNGGFWWWIAGGAILSVWLVLRGHFPNTFTHTRLGAGTAIVIVIGAIIGIGWWLG